MSSWRSLILVLAFSLWTSSAYSQVAQALECDAVKGICDRWLEEVKVGTLDVKLTNTPNAAACTSATLFSGADTLGSDTAPQKTGADVTAHFTVQSAKVGTLRVEYACGGPAINLRFDAKPVVHDKGALAAGDTFASGDRHFVALKDARITKAACTPAAGVTAVPAAATCALRALADGNATVLCEFTAQADHLKATLSCGGIEVAVTEFKQASPSPPASQGNDARTKQLAATALPQDVRKSILKELIGLESEESGRGHYYDRSNDVAVVFINADGSPYYPDLDVIDENDDLYVVVVDREASMTGISVEITGCDRPPLFRIYKPSSAGGPVSTRESEDENKKKTLWGWLVRPVGKCAGKESGVSAIVNRGEDARAATIRVNPLYNFSVGFALGYDATLVRRFDVRTAAGDTVPRVVESEDRIGLAKLLLISFYPTPRDFQKRDFFLPERIKLFVALDIEDLDEHLVLGAGYELLPGLDALFGWRVLTHQPVLAEGSGLEDLSRFDGDADELPIRKRWEIGLPFFGVGVTTNILQQLAGP